MEQRFCGRANWTRNKTLSCSLISKIGRVGWSHLTPTILISRRTRRRSDSVARRDHQIVETELKAPVDEFAEADALQHGLQNFDRDSLLVLFAFHFGADEACATQDCEDRIDR